MKKYFSYILLAIFAFCMSLILGSEHVFAAAINIPGTSEIQSVSANIGVSSNPVATVNSVGFEILRIVKLIIMGLLVIYVVYIGAQMIMSMGTNEEQLGAAKRQLWYVLIALVFINIPGVLFNAFYK